MHETVIDQSEEHSLVTKAQGGDRKAFEELTSRCRDRLVHLIQGRLRAAVRQRLDAEDLYQETAVRALESIKRFQWQGQGSFESWLVGITENVIRESCRNLRKEPSLDVFPGFPGKDVSPSKHMRRGERFERLREAISALPEDYRKVILLARIEGLKIEEIAEQTGRSVSSVKNLLLRGMRELRESFGDTESLHLPDKRLNQEGNGNVETR